jgi:2-polyprenyl-6-methoxyphenol hydroxylase-like FAD-dependent oxidoreductase
MTAVPPIDVAIIGAGPVGMALACELIRHGLSVRIVDKAPATKDYSRAPVFWPRAQEALDLMGLYHLWDGRTVPMHWTHVNIYGRPAGAVAMDQGDSAYPVPMLVGQDVTEQILDAHLRTLGTPVERATEAVRVDVRDDGATVTIRPASGSEEVFEAAWVIGCEGAHSLVRGGAEIDWEGHALKGLMVPIADATVKWPLINAVGHSHVALTDKGYLLTIPLPGVQRIIVAVPDTTPEGEEPTITREGMEAVASEAIGGPVELLEAPWIAVVRYGNHLASAYRAGRALLAGDAAHSIAPLSGQGMNTGVQDAFDLAWKLAYVHKGWAPDALLDSYGADRRPVAERLVHATDRFFDIVLDPGAAQKRLFRAAGPTALKFQKVRDTIAEFYTELDVSYAHSPLNDEHTRRHPGPGEHVRDGELASWPHREPLRFYDLLRGLHWTVIAFSGAEPEADELDALERHLEGLVRPWGPERLAARMIVQATKAPLPAQGATVQMALDAWGGLHQAYGAGGGALLLVRPDGYVAFHRSARPSDFEALTAHVSRVLGEGSGA